MCRRASGAQDVLYDLRPFMFGSPLLMQEGASLTRALTLFRQMGLHHILVAPQDPRAIGFITRKVESPPCRVLLCTLACVTLNFQSLTKCADTLSFTPLRRIWSWTMHS